MVENQSGQALIALMEQEAAQLGIPVNFAASGGASDASIPSQEGVGTIDACGPIGFNLHNDDEHILLSSVRPRLALLLAVQCASDRKVVRRLLTSAAGECWNDISPAAFLLPNSGTRKQR